MCARGCHDTKMCAQECHCHYHTVIIITMSKNTLTTPECLATCWIQGSYWKSYTDERLWTCEDVPGKLWHEKIIWFLLLGQGISSSISSICLHCDLRFLMPPPSTQVGFGVLFFLLVRGWSSREEMEFSSLRLNLVGTHEFWKGNLILSVASYYSW